MNTIDTRILVHWRARVASGLYDHGPVGKPTGPLAAPRLVVEAQVEAGRMVIEKQIQKMRERE